MYSSQKPNFHNGTDSNSFKLKTQMTGELKNI